jgi:hypothetical protein
MAFEQVKKVRLKFDGDVEVNLPKRLKVLDVISLPDPYAEPYKNREPMRIPYLIYHFTAEDEMETKRLRLVAGEAEMDNVYDQWLYLGCTSPKKDIPNFYTLWCIVPRKNVSRPAPKPAPKKEKRPVDPECQKARDMAAILAGES